MRIKLVAATAPTLIKALVLTLFNILDLLSIKTRSRITKRTCKFYHITTKGNSYISGAKSYSSEKKIKLAVFEV
ncbi:hypothetical protein PC0014_11370 [Streptococcus pneumoniae]|nr:33.8 kDa early protein [Streptococcus pneumoniae]BDS64992.1 hypothetical protein PC0014_11370 [Streptococcus pneumoniae]